MRAYFNFILEKTHSDIKENDGYIYRKHTTMIQSPYQKKSAEKECETDKKWKRGNYTMAIIFNEKEALFNLCTKNSLYQMKADSYGVLLHTYYGKKTELVD